MLFIPSTASPRSRAAGSTSRSKLLNDASKQLSGICTESNGKP